MTINIHKFAKRFGEAYDFLYNGDYEDTYEYREAVNAFDEMCKNNESFAAFVREYVHFRKDYISSDREAAAFMLALEECMTDNETAALERAFS